MERQAILDRPDPPSLHVVLDEAVILRQVGGAQVMTEQVAKLRKAAQRPGVVIDIVPMAAGAHAAMGCSTFVILDFADPAEDPSVVYLDTPSSAAYLQKPDDLAHYTATFDQLLDRTTPLLEHTT